MNGKYKVGGGKIVLYPSDGSDAKTVATDVNIKVTDKAHCGYYVFIYDFPGSDRAEGFKSAYNNPWERSFVTQGRATRHIDHQREQDHRHPR